jgi:two-component system, OmpR family, sensor kinase
VLDRLSLRSRLVLGVIVLALVGLAVANVATYASLRSFLIEQTDRALDEAQPGIERELREHGCGREGGPPFRGASSGDYVAIRDSGGETLCGRQFTDFGDDAQALPELTGELDNRVADLAPGDAAYVTVEAQGGGSRYRVRASIEPQSGTTLLVARSLETVDATLGRLLWIEVLVTAAVLACLGLLGLVVVRLGLRPLTDIGKTAAAIAAGDLSRRVERAEPRTEVGRLGLALNAMLGRIEAAFKAQAASEQRLRRFVADASHELRTPLAAVRAYAELFSRGAASRPGDLDRSMRGITRESERMTELVEDLLLLARLDEGRPLERAPVALAQVIKEAVETARMVDPGRPITVELEPASILGDRARLRQIVDNLLGNVRAHTPAGAPVRVRLARMNGNAAVTVADSGPGLGNGDAERVFERFYRADAARASTEGGTGLGLAIARWIVDLHGGEIHVERNDPRGCRMVVTLPRAGR